MRTTLRLVLPLAASVICVSAFYSAHQVRTERRNLRNDLSYRAAALAETFRENLESNPALPSDKNLNRLFERHARGEHLSGAAVYDRNGMFLAKTPGLFPYFDAPPPQALRTAQLDAATSDFLRVDGESLHIHALPLHRNAQVDGELILVFDTSYIQARVMRIIRASIYTILLQTLLITSLAIVFIRWNVTAPVANTAKWLRTLRSGGAADSSSSALPPDEMFAQIHKEARHLARDLSFARATAQEEAQLRETQSAVWTSDRLRVSLRDKLHGHPLFVVSNREPYMHVFNERDNSIQMIVPASGLVTALEPVLHACQGTWIANGSGNADSQVVDHNDHLQVPPHRPTYTLRRVWLTKEEDLGYYEGFSNEGLWPLCHIAHTRPTFRPEDWAYYQKINQRFADAVVQEMKGTESPVVFVQDYHFSLLPRMVKEARPDARVAIFWHIPWPNPEVFGICPWQKELLDGLLGADLIGFQIRTHCNNFLGTVDHALEALTDWDRFEVYRRGHVTRVRPYPISVAFSQKEEEPTIYWNSGEQCAALFEKLGVEASLLGVGVDRLDYTKGILERFRSIERFLELYPAYLMRFTFVQIGAPSRTDIPRYRQFLDEITAEAGRINERFQSGRWKPIVLLKKHHSHEEIEPFYRAASVCLVTSLHDGMNLVAKEFVVSRRDNRGVLILSTFTGAAQELPDALLINPYDVDQVAHAIHRALGLGEDQQEERMGRMRKTVLEHNVYGWAASLLSDLVEIRVEAPEHSKVARAS
jgi:trehalose-6-phosphate synthase